MGSERIFYSRRDVLLFILSVILLVSAGIVISGKRFIPSALLLSAGMLALFQVIKSYRQINLAANGFFEAMGNDDTAFRFSEVNDNEIIAGLCRNMNNLRDHFQAIRMKSEFNEAYYKSIIQYSTAGMIVMNESNEIELINKAACTFAGISPDAVNTSILRIKYPAFYSAVCEINPGENRTFRNIIANTLTILSFRATTLKRQEKALKLVSIQDIRYELDARELESYRKLMNVMNHEIMNLLTPLTTVARELSSSFDRMGERGTGSGISPEIIAATKKGLDLIGEHGDSLMSFVNNYRKISRLPRPEYMKIDIPDWTEQLKIAYSGPMSANNIKFTINADRSLRTLMADKRLLNQAVINIINNSIDAVKDGTKEGIIEMNLMNPSDGNIIIRISNNGPAIPSDIADRIFIPFFTTKTNGSGIGLSISQEIVRLHKGSLTFISKEDGRTCFIISIPMV